MSFFEVNPPIELDLRVLKAATETLADSRRALRRRRFVQWFFVPAFSTAALLIALRARQAEVPNPQLAEFADWGDVSESDYAVIDDLEIMEDLDVLEKWEDS